MNRLVIILFLSFTGMALHAQKTGYQIQVTINNYKDSVLYLVNYYGNTNQIKDTVYIKGNTYTFKGKESLPGGIYLIVTKERKYFEVLVDKEQHFSVVTDEADYVANAKFKGTQDNDDFYAYLKFLADQDKARKDLEAKYKDKTDEASKEELKKGLENVNAAVENYKNNIIKTKPESFLAIIINASKEPEIPTVLPLKDDGTPDSSYIYRYYKSHFFDDFNLADERLLRTPLYASKVKKYFKQILLQHPDTLIKEADIIIAAAKPNKETYKFNIWYFTYETETSQIMGMDAVFVHLAMKYYKTGEAYWVNDQVRKNIVDRAETLDRLLIGKPAPNMIMWDTTSNLKSMYNIKANYTIIMFWDPDCGHCKHEIPEVRDWLIENGDKYGVKIFSVCSDTNLVKWRQFLREYKITEWDNVNGTRSATENYHDLYDIISTPTIYLIDKDKKILAKRLGYSQLIEFIARDYRNKNKAAAESPDQPKEEGK